MLRCVLVFAAALGCLSLATVAHTQPDKKADAGKIKDKDDKGKPKEPPKGKLPLDKLKLPKDAIVVVVDNLLDAMAMFPDVVVLSAEKYAELQERIKSLEKQLKQDKKTPFSCKLHGKLEDDFLICRAEFHFSTEQPRTVVALGLQGGHLLNVGDLDSRPPILETAEDGFSVRVDKEGDHQLVLNFRVPATVKKSTTGGVDRGVKLGLAESAVTVVNLELPASVKELRCNDVLEKTKTPGRWLIGLEKSTGLNLAWKEPAPLSGNAAPKSEGQIGVRIDDKDVNLSAKLFLQDARGQTTEWRIAAPAQAKVEVESPPTGLSYELLPPEGGKAYHTLKTGPTAERWQVSVSLSVPRPNPGVRVPIGPVHVLGAQQTGTISVTMPALVSFGQRLVFTRTDALRQLKNTETEAVFEYVLDKTPKGGGNLKAPLEVEWRFEKNQAKTEVEHLLKLRAVNQGWEIDATTRIKVTALFSTVNALDVKLPQPYPRGVSLIGTATPGIPFPGSLPWAGMWKTFGMPWTYANPDDFTMFDEASNPLKPGLQDATGKMRVIWERGPAKQMTLVLKNSYRIPPQTQHIRMELPRPLNTQDRGAKVSIQADERIELLHGPAGAEEPVTDRDRFEQSFDQAPGFVELAWRPSRREIVAQATIDIDVHEHSAQVQQTLRFPRVRPAGGPDAKNPLIELVVPAGIDKPSAVSGGEITAFDRARHKAWLRPGADSGDIDVVLQYDLPVKNKLLKVTPIWPVNVSQEDVKVRVWAPAGVHTHVSAETLQRGVWRERSIEVVPDKKHFPALVLVGFGADLPLALEFEETAETTLAAFLADRALIQVRTLEDGSQQVQARYMIRKLNAGHVDVELPLPLARFRDRPTFALGKVTLGQWRLVDATEKVVRVQVPRDLVKLPAVLEINYTIPPEGLERTSFWRTTLHAPIFRSEVVIGQMRWQLSAPTPMIAASLGRGVRADVEWGWQSWLLTPEPGVTGAELEGWLLAKEPAEPGGSATFAFWHVQPQAETVYHLPRQWWLLSCSGIFLIVGLGCYLAPLPRWAFWLVPGAFALGAAVFAVLCPAAWAPVLFGMQPGVVLLGAFVGVHLLMQERYRRQLVFLPGFTRAKQNSTVARAPSAKRSREASTVDAPPGAQPSASAPAGSQAGS